MSTSQRVSRGFHRLGLFLAGAFFLPGILVAAYFVLEAQDAAYRDAMANQFGELLLCTVERDQIGDATIRTGFQLLALAAAKGAEAI